MTTPHLKLPEPPVGSGPSGWAQILDGLNRIDATSAVSLKARGAVGDGVADDIDALEAWLADLPGKVGIIEPGTYNYTRELVIPSNCMILGHGRMSRLKPIFSGTGKKAIKNDLVNGNQNIYLRNFCLDRSGAFAEHGFIFNGVTNLLMDGIEIIGTPTAGGAVAISGVGAATTIESVNVWMHRMLLDSHGNFGLALQKVRHARIVGCHILNAYRGHITIEPQTGDVARDILVQGNQCTTGAVFAGTHTGCIIVTNTSGGTCRDIDIDDNQVRGLSVIASNTLPGIQVVGAEHVSVTRNRVRDMNGSGIILGLSGSPVDHVDCIDNRVRDCNKGANGTPHDAAIRLREADKCWVRGNRVFGADHTYSIEEQTVSAGEFNLIEDNWVDKPIRRADVTTRRRFNEDTSKVGRAVAADLAKRVRQDSLVVEALSVTGANTKVATLKGAFGNTENYSGLVIVVARSSDTNSSNTAIYVLAVGKHAAGSAVTEIAKNGLTDGASATRPSFTWGIDTTNNELEASPVGSTSGTFYFHIVAHGDLELAA